MSPQSDDFTVRWQVLWLALPIGLFATAMVGSLGRELLRPEALPFLALAGLLTYLTLAFLLNRAHCRVRGGVLTVVHRPLPWPGPRVEMASVTALEVSAKPGRDGVASWELQALLRDGGSTRLLGPPEVGLSYSDLAEASAGLARFLGVPLR